MKVDALKVGEMYNTNCHIQILSNPILKHHIRAVEQSYCANKQLATYNSLPIGIQHIALWNHKRFNVSDEKAFLYLGYTRDKWSLSFARNIIKKHHWFLFSGKKVFIDNYSIRFLQKIKRCENE